MKLSNDAIINDKSIFQFIQKLMSGRKPISVNKNVRLKFHPINNYLKQNINPNKNEMWQIKGSIINNNKNNNDYFELQINALKNQLKEEKDKNQILINENKNLNAIILQLNSDMNKLKDKIKYLENDLGIKNMEIQKLIS